ncbi:hypothetical protein BB561_006806 [Smittium simulii]|uniref:Uncharacterized protein n=1 Tax=Smittium simulii TaxID=133385 RepID=A0A2T9Y1B2_9FUNG|nr:hypothetical protein BB561_006806 [Smittium simulii]
MLVWNLLFLGVVNAKMSGVKYSPTYDKSCKTGTSLQKDVNVIAGSANSVLINFFDTCNVGESIKKFAAKGVDIYLDIAADIFESIEYDQQKFERFISTEVFKAVKGISVSSDNGIMEMGDIIISNNMDVIGFNDAVSSFRLNKERSSIDSTEFALKLFNENFVSMQDLKKPIYLEIKPGTGKFSDKSFFDVLRELECRQYGTINYFVADNFGSDSIFRKSGIYNKLENLNKNTFYCKGHEYIGNW